MGPLDQTIHNCICNQWTIKPVMPFTYSPLSNDNSRVNVNANIQNIKQVLLRGLV
ncbi:hypothetical protein V1282_000278 [Nitrobacteraceae bacterium AZCC 2146]